MSARKFNALNTEERLERLLHQSGIPLSIPAEMANLKRSALARRTGSAILTGVRNALVHPRKQKRTFLRNIDPITLFEVKELGLSYLELSFLSALGYSGSYARRCFAGWRGQHLARVPWA